MNLTSDDLDDLCFRLVDAAHDFGQECLCAVLEALRDWQLQRFHGSLAVLEASVAALENFSRS